MDEIDCFKINETSTFRFYQMPKELFTNPYYKNKLSLEAKVTYTLLLDRMTLSKINKWFNDKGEIYLIFTRKEIMSELRIGNATASKVFKELANCGLLKEERIGQGMANRIYIGKIKSEEIEEYKKRVFRNAEEEYQEILNRISKNSIWNTNDTDSNNTEIFNRKKENFSFEKVLLTCEQLDSLLNTYGDKKTAKIILSLNLYKKSTGKKYESDYDAILNWVINKVERDEDKKKLKYSEKQFKKYNQREYDDLEIYYDNV